jgi:dTDP-L-rhamnose 4-epimerase
LKVLVTGGAGFIGSHFVDALVAASHEVTVLDNLDAQVHGAAAQPTHIAGHIQSGAVRFHPGDVTDRAALLRSLEGVEAVVHLAATVGVGQSMYQPDYYVRTNCLGTGLLLDVLVGMRQDIRKLVVASSMSIYGEGAYACPTCAGRVPRERTEDQLERGEWEPLCARCGEHLHPEKTPETKTAEIASVYAATKKHQEDLLVSFGRAYRIPTFALRFFNVFGPRQSLSNPYTGVAAIFLSRLLNGRAPLVFEDGRQSRDFVEVRDVARALLLSTESDSPGVHVLNVGTGRALSVLEVGQALSRALGVAIEPELLGKYRAGDIRHCVADPRLAQEVLGFRAAIAFEEGLPDLISWCRSQQPRDTVDASLDELRRKGLVR